MTSFEDQAPLQDISLRTLDEIKEIHRLDDEWKPRFSADTPIAEQKAEEYRALGYEAEVFPHPDDVATGELPGRGDRCVVYTRGEPDQSGGGIDDALF